ncbi:hypothetical protein IGJ91_001256 [Enterococcus sp. DIV0765f]
MPFIVYFFMTFVVIYIPVPTIIFLFFRFTEHITGMVILYKLILLILLMLDIKLGFNLLYNKKIKKRNYITFLLLNILEELMHIYFFYTYHKSIIFILCIAQILLLSCAFLFPLSKNFRKFLF